MEALGTPKHRSPSGCHHPSLPIRIGLDARRKFDRIYHKSPGCGQTWSRRCPQLLYVKCLYTHQLFDIAEGLNYLHSCNAIHGDLKGVRDCPNCSYILTLTHCQPTILVDATGHARITDFGLATVTRSPDFVWNADQGHAVRWIAPEILNGQGSYSKEADVFSFAMVVIEVRCG